MKINIPKESRPKNLNFSSLTRIGTFVTDTYNAGDLQITLKLDASSLSGHLNAIERELSSSVKKASKTFGESLPSTMH